MVLVEIRQAVVEVNRRIQVIWKGKVDCALDCVVDGRPECRAIVIIGCDCLLAPRRSRGIIRIARVLLEVSGDKIRGDRGCFRKVGSIEVASRIIYYDLLYLFVLSSVPSEVYLRVFNH